MKLTFDDCLTLVQNNNLNMDQPTINIRNVAFNGVIIHQAINFPFAKKAVLTLISMHAGELIISAGSEEDEECNRILAHVSTFNFRSED